MLTPTAAQHQVHILSLPSFNRNLWDMCQTGVFKNTDARQLLMPTYTWDMHQLAEQIGTRTSSGYHVPDNAEWHPIWCNNITLTDAQNVYERVSTPFSSTVFATVDASSYVQSTSFSAPPLVTESYGLTADRLNVRASEVREGLLDLYRACFYPSWPCMIATTLPDTKHYGPLVPTSISFAVSGQSKISPVTISTSWKGGRSLQVRDRTLFEFGRDDFGKELLYRGAATLDCFVQSAIYTNIDVMLLDMELYEMPLHALFPTQRLVEMRLNITQSLNHQITQGVRGFTDEDGPRFFTTGARAVTGELKYWGIEQSPQEIESSNLTMFFGGPFLFPMSNVLWQKPKTEAAGGGGYTHTYSFLALAVEGASLLNSEAYAQRVPVSEFEITDHI